MKKKKPSSLMKSNLPFILLACKDAAKVSFFKETLKGKFSLVHVTETQEALEWLKTSPVDVFIVEQDALTSSLKETCKTAQKITKKKKTPILLIGGSNKTNAVLEALSDGVSDFIHEPLDALKVLERIAVCLNTQQIHKKMKAMRGKIKTAGATPRAAKMMNERTFIRDATLKAISTAKKGAVPLSVLMIHLDGFSKLEDALEAADLSEVFSFLETFLKSRLRKYDTFIKEGPGQYLTLLPKTSQSAGTAIAQDLRKEISRTTIKLPAKEILVTVSIGVVSFEKELSKSAKNFEQFDLCLERVKKSLIRAQKKGNAIVSDS